MQKFSPYRLFSNCECHLREDICEGGGPQVCVEAPRSAWRPQRSAVLAAPWRRRWMCTRSPTRGRSPTSRRWPTNRMRRTPLHSAPQRPSRTSGGCTCTCAGPWTSAQRFATITSSARESAPCGRTTPTKTVANGSCGSKRASWRASGRILCARLTAHTPPHYDERVTKKALTLTYPWPCAQLLAILGGQFRVGDEICGCVLSIRYQEDILSVWNKSADSRRVCMQIRDTMRSVMSLPESATMECKQRCSKTRRAASCRLVPVAPHPTAPRRMLTRNPPRTHIVPLAQTRSTPTRCATTAPTATRTPTSEPHSSFCVGRAARACVRA